MNSLYNLSSGCRPDSHVTCRPAAVRIAYVTCRPVARWRDVYAIRPALRIFN